MKEFREYIGWNREIGDEALWIFINENGVKGIESNGEPTYEGEIGFYEVEEEIEKAIKVNPKQVKAYCAEKTIDRIRSFTEEESNFHEYVICEWERG